MIKDIKYLREFVTLSEFRNYARAADELFISQSTLSKHILAFENDLGHTLFIRSTRRVELSEFGASFLPYAKAVLAALADCDAFLVSCGAGESVIMLGALRSLYLYTELSDILTCFPEVCPGCKLQIMQDTHDHLKERLNRHEFRLIIVRESVGYETTDYSHLTIYTDPVCIMLPRDHPLSGKESISLTDVAGEAFILPPQGTALYGMFLDACHDAGFTPDIGYQISSKEYCAQLVRRHEGLAILGKTVANHYAGEDLTVVPLSPQMHESINLIYPKLSRLTQPERKLLEYLRVAFAQPGGPLPT